MGNTSNDAFFSALGEFVLSWAYAEAQIKSLTESILNPGQSMHTQSLDLGSSNLDWIIREATNQQLEPELAIRLQHLLELYVILRGYWSYWTEPNLKDRSSHPHAFFAKYVFQNEITKSVASQITAIKKITCDCYGLGTFAHAIMHTRKNYERTHDSAVLPELYPIPPEIKH